jgi:hypothetical protein
MSNTARVPKVLFSNANLAETVNVLAPPHRPIISPHTVGKFAMDAGFDGVDWHPFFPMSPGSVRNFARAYQRGDFPIFTLHQSVNNEAANPTPNRGIREKILATNVGQKLLLPTVADSVQFMNEIQRKTGKQVAALYFPHREREDDIAMLQEGGAKLNLYQPTAKELDWWEVDSAVGLETEAMERGYNACPDTHHIQGEKFGLLLAGSARNARAVHLSTARIDSPKVGVDTMQDFQMARSGVYGGRLGEVFDAVDELAGPPEVVVVETPVTGIIRATGFTALHDIQKVYQELAEGVQARYA